MPTADDQIIARVGNTDLKAGSLRTFVAGLGAHEQGALARDPAALSQIVRSLLVNKLVLEEAVAIRWDQRPEIIDQVQKARDATIVESYLRSITQPPADFPDEATVQEAYEANKSAFLVPRQYLVAQIYIALPNAADKTATDKALERLANVQRELKQQGADFSTIAHTYSDAKEAAERGGEIGWALETQLRPEIKAMVVGLAKGAVATPMKLDDGWHIIKLVDTKAAYTRSLEEVRSDLVDRLREERVASARRAYLIALLKRNPPAINELAITKLLGEPARVSPR